MATSGHRRRSSGGPAGSRSCSGTPSPTTPEYQLLFSYPEGPPVSVFILSGCRPEIDNLDLQSNSASSILPVIQQLTSIPGQVIELRLAGALVVLTRANVIRSPP